MYFVKLTLADKFDHLHCDRNNFVFNRSALARMC
jgi:hypothetical protein